jgi:cellulose synthase/poly-beta-1,6-N-acetylglucosamine synthase-like glycosyltransferase
MAFAFMIVAGLAGFCALHPFTTYPASLWLLRRFRFVPLPPRTSAAPPSFELAICMCAYNEEKIIEAKLVNLLALKRAYPGLEILIYVDAASDRTAELLRAHEQEIRLFVSTERLGKTHGMNLLVSKVTKPIIMFTDANVLIDQEAPARLLRYFIDPAIGCVSGHLQHLHADVTATAHSSSLYWRLDEWTKRLETDTGSAIGADGSLFAVRRELHRPPPNNIIEDMYVSMMIFCEGHRVVQADDVIAYEESIALAKDEFKRKIRVASCAFNVHRVLWPRVRTLSWLTRYKYVSHKWIRWFTIYFLAAGVVSFEIALVLAGARTAASALAAFAACALLGGAASSRGPLAQIWNILSAFVATGLGVLRSVRGERLQTWTPVSSIRK